MKKIAAIFCSLLILGTSTAWAMDFQIFDMRNKILDESKSIKAIMPRSSDAVVLINLFDTCLITMTKLDAYFSMLTIFETIKNENLTPAAVDALSIWLNDFKRDNEINIRNFNGIAPQVSEDSRTHVIKTMGLFDSLNSKIDIEANKLNVILRSLKVKTKK
jgi:hypothetical protein